MLERGGAFTTIYYCTAAPLYHCTIDSIFTQLPHSSALTLPPHMNPLSSTFPLFPPSLFLFFVFCNFFHTCFVLSPYTWIQRQFKVWKKKLDNNNIAKLRNNTISYKKNNEAEFRNNQFKRREQTKRNKDKDKDKDKDRHKDRVYTCYQSNLIFRLVIWNKFCSSTSSTSCSQYSLP